MKEEIWYNAEHNLIGLLRDPHIDWVYWDIRWGLEVALPFSDHQDGTCFLSQRKPTHRLQVHGWEFIGEV